MPVRVGVPQFVTGLSDVVSNEIHATGVGLLLYGARQGVGAPRTSAPATGEAGNTPWHKFKKWFSGEF